MDQDHTDPCALCAESQGQCHPQCPFRIRYFPIDQERIQTVRAIGGLFSLPGLLRHLNDRPLEPQEQKDRFMQSIESCVEAFGQNWFDGPYSASRNAVGMLVGLRDLVQNENNLHHLRTFIVNTINGCIRTLSPTEYNNVEQHDDVDEDSDPNDIGHEDAGADAEGGNRVAEGKEGGGQGRGGGSAGTGQQQGGHEDAGGNAEGAIVFPVKKKRVVARAGAESGGEAQSTRVQGNSKVGMRMLEVMLRGAIVFTVKKRVVTRAGAEAGADAQSARLQGNSKGKSAVCVT